MVTPGADDGLAGNPMRPDDPLTCQAAAFDIPADITYLNAAYISPISRLTRLAGERGVARKSAPWSIAWSDFHDETDVARGLFAALIGASAADIAIVPAVSYGMQIAARNLAVNRGDRIVVLRDQFPSNFYVWRDLARAREGVLDAVACPPDWRWSDAVIAHIGERTRIVALPQAHWMSGVHLDLPRIAEACRRHGAALVLDLSQSLGAVPFDVADVPADFVVCASYKWLLGPYSLGFLYAAPHRQEGMPLEAHAWSRSDARAPLEGAGGLSYTEDFLPGACRYDVGERANFALMPMAVQALRDLLTWRPARIAAYLAPLINTLCDGAASLGYRRVPPPSARSPHLVGVAPPPHCDLEQLRRDLAGARIHVSLRGGNIRVSPHIYNRPEDVARLLSVLRG